MAELLNNEEIEKASGGAELSDPSLFSVPEFKFTESEVKKLEEHGITGITHGVWYKRTELNEKGIPGLSKSDVVSMLAYWGIHVQVID